MWKPITLLPVLVFFLAALARGQCITAPPPPDCNETETLLTDNFTLDEGITRWYYGTTTTMNSLRMNGGTLIVCGDLTIDKFYMDSGTIFVRPGARFVIGGGIGEGLILRGHSYIYNYGRVEVQRNLSLDNGWATPEKPNIIFNSTMATFTMANQYLVINNANSWFVNNGASHFWGIITDPQSSPGSVCLGNGSTTRMSILINKVANTYSVPSGNACVYVNQWSQFYGALTSDSSLHACLGSGHSSDASCAPFGCTPNNWGAAHVLTNCAGCAAISVLPVRFDRFELTKRANERFQLEWHMNAGVNGGRFIVMRSNDGRNFIAIDSLLLTAPGQSVFQIIDNNPNPGENFYMINYTDPGSAKSIQSQTVRALFETISIYPGPLNKSFFIRHTEAERPQRVMVTDINGQNIKVKTEFKGNGITEILLSPTLPPGIYVVHLMTRNRVLAKTVVR